MNFCYLETSVGRLLIAGGRDAVHRIGFPKHGKACQPTIGWSEEASGAVGEAARQLSEYFSGTRTEFDLPLAPEGTEFQRAVWCQLRGIPYGETIAYGELARRV